MHEIIKIAGISMEVCLCITCGIPFAVPLTVIEHHRQNGGFHSCSNGHSQGWRREESEIGRLTRERDLLTQRIAQRDDAIKDLTTERDCARTSLIKSDEERKRVTMRANNGVCQDCHRSFANLVRHRATKHSHIKLVAS